MTTKSKLRQIEKTMRSKSSEDIMAVFEHDNNPGVFRGTGKDGINRVYSEEELERLEASGVNILRVIFTHKAQPEEDGS